MRDFGFWGGGDVEWAVSQNGYPIWAPDFFGDVYEYFKRFSMFKHFKHLKKTNMLNFLKYSYTSPKKSSAQIG